MGLVKDSAVTLSTKIATFILSAVTSIIIARVLGPAGKGVWAILFLIPGLIAMVFCLGLNFSNVYLLGTRRYSTPQVLSNAIFSTVIMSVVSVALFLLLFERIFSWIPKQTNGINPTWVKIMLFSVPLLLLTAYFNSILQGKREINKVNLVNLVQTGLSCITVLLFVMVLKKAIGGLIASYFIFNFGSAALALFLVLRLTEHLGFRFNARLLKDSIVIGTKSYLGSLLQFLNYRLDMFLVYYFLSSRDVGHYSVAVALTEMLWWVSQSVSVPFLPQVSTIGEQRSASFTPAVSRMTLLMTLAPALVLLLAGRGVVSLLYGSAFLPAVPAIYILLPGVVIVSSWRILAHHFLGSGKPLVNAKVSLASLLLNVLLNIFLIPRLGIRGAALATTVSYSLGSYLIFRVFASETSQSVTALLVPQRQDFVNFKSGLSKLYSGRTVEA